MNKQQCSKECLKEQISTEEQKELLGKEEKKASEWIEVLVNSSVEMSFKTDSDLLKISIAPESINQMPQLNENFLLEPNGSRSIFQQTEERTKEFTEEIAIMANVIVERMLQVVETEYQQSHARTAIVMQKMPQPLSQMASSLWKKQQLWNRKEKKSTEFIGKDSVTMKKKTESEVIVTSGTIAVSGTDKLETLE